MAEHSLTKTIVAGIAVAVASPIILHFLIPEKEPEARVDYGSDERTSASDDQLDSFERRVQLEREQLELLREKVRLTKELNRRPGSQTPVREPASVDTPDSRPRGPREGSHHDIGGSYVDQTGAAYTVAQQGASIQITQLLYGMPVFVLTGSLVGRRANLSSPQPNVLMQIYGVSSNFLLEVPDDDPGTLYVTLPGVMTYRLKKLS